MDRLKRNKDDSENHEMKETMLNLYNEGHPNQNYTKKVDAKGISANTAE